MLDLKTADVTPTRFYQEVLQIRQQESRQEQDFFELAGIWENKDITPESLRIEAWSREKP